MGLWQAMVWSLAIVGGLAAIYGLHRLALWLENRGYLYYIHKKPKGSSAGCFVAIQRAIEPQSQHVEQACEEVSFEENRSTGSDHPPWSVPNNRRLHE